MAWAPLTRSGGRFWMAEAARTGAIAMRMRFAVVVLTVAFGVAAFSPAAPAAAGTSTAPIVGRWQQSHTCDELVSALNALGLGALAPGVVRDYFPNLTPEELAAK